MNKQYQWAGGDAIRVLVLVLMPLVAASARAAPADDRRAAARAHYVEGSKFYDTGRYLDAAAEYERAFFLVDEPSLLFNMGQAYRLGGDAARALRSYRAYLRRAPEAGGRAEVEAKIAELQRAIEQREHAKQGPPEGTLAPKPPPAVETPRGLSTNPPPPIVPRAPSEERRRPWYTSGVGWGLAGSGIALVAAGGGLLGESAALEGNAARAQSQLLHDAALSSAGPYRWSGAALVSVGGALVVSGVVVFALHNRRNR